ncbi:MAG: hypothetical protein HXY37_08245 [Chloroflexi bacterium]|nr:hypothetical protein [Chloroflexota bacterium]
MTTLQQELPSLSVRQLCVLLDVSRSWLYERPNPPTQAERDVALRDAIERIVLEFPGYGYRRVTQDRGRRQREPARSPAGPAVTPPAVPGPPTRRQGAS